MLSALLENSPVHLTPQLKPFLVYPLKPHVHRVVLMCVPYVCRMLQNVAFKKHGRNRALNICICGEKNQGKAKMLLLILKHYSWRFSQPAQIPLSPVSNDPFQEDGTLNQPRIIDLKNTEQRPCYALTHSFSWMPKPRLTLTVRLRKLIVEEEMVSSW